MARKGSSEAALDYSRAAAILRENWQAVCEAAAHTADLSYVGDRALEEAIRASINHKQVAYRFCLPIQLLGKVTNPALDCLRLQKKKGDPTDVSGWDARSLGSRVVAPFNIEQEAILGTSTDPYVGNPMRIPRMVRDDPSKKDIVGWNTLVGILERVQTANDPDFTLRVFRQALLEMFRLQQSLRFDYVLPPRISLEATLAIAHRFLDVKSGGDRALALCGGLFDAIGIHFGLYSQVNRARINASDEAVGQAADLECLNTEGKVVLAVEVKDRTLTLADVEGTLRKSRKRAIKDILFTCPAVKPEEQSALEQCVARAYAAGQNLRLRLLRLRTGRSRPGRRSDSHDLPSQSRRAPQPLEHPTRPSSGVEEIA